MIEWLRRVLAFPGPDRRSTSRDLPAVEELPHVEIRSTRAELERTAKAHKARIQKADRVLVDFERMDGALRLVRRR